MSDRRAWTMSDYDIRLEGWKALTERLGVSGAMRFLTQYDPGHGDYSQERHELLGPEMLDELLDRIRRQDPEDGTPSG